MTNQLLTKKFQGMDMSEKIKEISGFKDENNYEDRDLTSNFFFAFSQKASFHFLFNEKSEHGLF